MDAQALQTVLGHEFVTKALLQQALTHRSHSVTHNERLEFLGDSVLNCVVAFLLFEKFPKIDEGDLSRLRANLVKQQSLYEIAQRLELSPFLRLGEGELKSGGFRRPSILADTVEALFGAVFLDAGFDVARSVIGRLYQPVLDTVDPKTLGKDAKTLLQEYLQGRKIALPVYTVVATHGAAHSQEFEVECAVPKLSIQVLGAGGSRRAAEQAAAKKALEASQALLVATGKRTRRPKSAQLSLPVATEQTAQAPSGAAGSGSRKSAEQEAARASAGASSKASEALRDASTESASATASPRSESAPAKIVASAGSRATSAPSATADAIAAAVSIKADAKAVVKSDAKIDARADPSPNTKAAASKADIKADSKPEANADAKPVESATPPSAVDTQKSKARAA